MCQVYFSWFHGCSVVPSKLGFDMPLVHLLGIECFVGRVTGLADTTSSIRCHVFCSLLGLSIWVGAFRASSVVDWQAGLRLAETL